MPTKRLVQSGHGNVIHNCQQLRTTLCPPIRKQINCGIATPREYHSSVKRGELVINTRARMNLNHYVKLKGGRHKRIYKQFYLWSSRTGKTNLWPWMLVVAWGWRSREFDWQEVTFRAMEVLYVKLHWTEHLRHVFYCIQSISSIQSRA